jgi:hypothetical protein
MMTFILVSPNYASLMALNGDILSDNNGNNKKCRNIPRREWAKREIHGLIVNEGLTNREVCAHLNLPKRTFDRYLHEIYHDDNLVLVSPSIDDVMTAANIFKDRLTKQRRDILDGIANNPEIDASTRVEAHHLAAEIEHAIFKLSYETPVAVARKLNLDNAGQLVQEQKGLNIRLVKNDK